MKKNILPIISVVLIVGLLACNLIQIRMLLNDKAERKTAEEIYNGSLHSVVELRAYDDDGKESFGTAVFINDSGKLVTNAHVITHQVGNEEVEFPHISIRFAFEDEYRSVSILNYNNDLDLAYLILDEKDSAEFSPIAIGDSSNLKSGQKVYAIGNSSNYGISISEGIVGVPLATIQYSDCKRQAIQCDLTIVSGNSGGALVNEKGELVGIPSFRAKDGSGGIIYGIAYCVPSNLLAENAVQ